jgi:hypothetical protein
VERVGVRSGDVAGSVWVRAERIVGRAWQMIR